MKDKQTKTNGEIKTDDILNALMM